MAQIDEIIGKEIIQQFIDFNTQVDRSVENLINLQKAAKETKADINSNVDSWTKLKTVQEQTANQTKKLTEAEKEQSDNAEKVNKLTKSQIEYMDKLSKAHKDSVFALQNENKELNKQRVLLDTNSKEYAELSKRIATNTDKLKAHDKEIGRNYLNVGNYGSAIKGIGTKLLGFASGLGAGIGAMAAFKAVMSSTEAISDTFARNIEGIKEGFGFLARSIANLDFSNLIQGFRDAFSEGKRYADVLDEIEDRERALGIRQKEIEGQILDQKVILKSNAQSVEAKEAAIAEIIRLQKVQLDETQGITKLELDNQLQNAAAEVFGAKQVTEERKALILDFVSASGAAFDAYKVKLDEAAALEEKLNSLIRVSVDDRGRMSKDMSAYNKAVSELTPNQKELLDLLQISNGVIGEKRDLIANAAKEDIGAVNAQKEGLVSLERYENQLRNEYLKGKEAEIKIATKTEDDKVKAAEDAKERRIKLMDEEIDYEAGLYDAEIKAKVEAEAAKTKAAADAIEANKKLREAQIDWEIEQDIAEEERRVEAAETRKQQDIDIAMQTAQALQEIGNMAFEAAAANIQAELDKNQQAKEYELQLAGDNKGAIAVINEKYAEKEKQLKIKAAKQSKAQALFNAIIGTAMATVNGFMSVPFLPVGLAMGILAGVLGTVQIGLIAGQPIPQFFKGTDNAPDGLISVGEKGQELIQTRSGKTLLARNRTLLSGMKGATIYSNQETEAILKAGRGGYDSKELRDTLTANNDKLIKTIRDKKELHLTPPPGTRITARNGAYFTNYWTRKLGQ